jgi:hypothetical protein
VEQIGNKILGKQIAVLLLHESGKAENPKINMTVKNEGNGTCNLNEHPCLIHFINFIYAYLA